MKRAMRASESLELPAGKTVELKPGDACHCLQCRRQSGHYWASTNIPRDKLTVRGMDKVTWFQSSEKIRRGFCGTGPHHRRQRERYRLQATVDFTRDPRFAAVDLDLAAADRRMAAVLAIERAGLDVHASRGGGGNRLKRHRADSFRRGETA